MSGSNGFAAADHHLIEGAAVRELRVELSAKFTKAAGPGVEAVVDVEVNVFHKSVSWGKDGFARFCEPESQYSASADYRFVIDAFVLHRTGTAQVPSDARKSSGPATLQLQKDQELRGLRSLPICFSTTEARRHGAPQLHGKTFLLWFLPSFSPCPRASVVKEED